MPFGRTVPRLAVLLAMSALAASLPLSPACGEPSAPIQQGSVQQRSVQQAPPSLRETLESGLRARRPAEFAFIGKVVRLVERGTLPRALVDSTFLWAQRHPVPYPYFEAGLRFRAKRIGVAL